ncbi:MAG: DUF4399 domain-containing protein [Gemmatimonadales bacterium]
MRRPTLAGPLLLLVGCGGGTPRAADSGATVSVAPPIAVRIVSPATGDTVGPELLVRLSVSGARAVPADGSRQDGEGHHHLFVDADPTPGDSVIPKLEGIYHIGTGADTLTLSGLAPGRHRLIAIFAFGDHVPVPGVAPDTAWIVVR